MKAAFESLAGGRRNQGEGDARLPEVLHRGKWVEPAQPKTLEVINPATKAVCGHISLGSAADVDRAVKAAREAFKSFSRTSRKERVELLERIVAESKKRHEDMAKAITEEMGAPVWLAQRPRPPWGRPIS